MKTLNDYYTQLSKTYKFKIKIACDITAEQISKIPAALSSYDVANDIVTTRLPIQKHPDFPQLNANTIHVIDIELNYPCNDAQVKQCIINALNIPTSHILVTNTNTPEELMQNYIPPVSDTALLQTPFSLTEPNNVGDNYNKQYVTSLNKNVYQFVSEIPSKTIDPYDAQPNTKSYSPISGIKFKF